VVQRQQKKVTKAHLECGLRRLDRIGPVPTMTKPVSRTMLVYGATGRAGRLVAERALLEGWAVSAFVRNPDKVPEALRSKVTS